MAAQGNRLRAAEVVACLHHREGHRRRRRPPDTVARKGRRLREDFPMGCHRAGRLGRPRRDLEDRWGLRRQGMAVRWDRRSAGLPTGSRAEGRVDREGLLHDDRR